jgi:hypothetical protein
MAITLNGTTGISNDGGYTGDGISFADTTPSNTLVTDTSGNVGIGNTAATTLNNTSLAAKLAVGTGATHAGVTLYTSTSTNGTVAFADGTSGADPYIGYVQYQHGNDSLSFGTVGTERMRIDSSGKVLVNNTSSLGNGMLQTTATSGTNGLSIATPASYTNISLLSVSATAASTNWYHFVGQSSNATVNNILINGNGNVQNANNSYGGISDVKLKENIVDASPKLNKLMQVKVRNYNLKGDYEQHKQLGVIAQELEQVFPSMVEEKPDRDADGNDLGTTTKSVKYSVLVPMLIKAIQEQQAIITDLKSRIEALEAK